MNNKNKQSHWPKDHPKVAYGQIGILLLNLGTPDATDYFSMRRYLKEFLSDRRVIEVNPVKWWLILNGPVLTKRPFSSGEAYKKIWNKELDESPLLTITRSQTEKTETALKQRINGDNIHFAFGMRYGNPSIKSALDELAEKGCDRILVFPLYPQYAAATTATACDKLFDALKQMRWQPTIRIVPPYFENPDYIEAVADGIEDHLAHFEWEPEVVLASFHGLPKSYLLKGDPYHCQSVKTGRLIREYLSWSEKKFQITFQSRFGKEEWLQPYTDETIEKLAKQGVKRMAVVTPGFAADCVETLEEIAIEAKHTFMENGGEQFTVVPCLNNTPDAIRVLNRIIMNELAGWVE